jgi:hypothetical protein
MQRSYKVVRTSNFIVDFFMFKCIVWAVILKSKLIGSGREFHHCLPTEPDVNRSIHADLRKRTPNGILFNTQ